jgi:hypothetical protein
MCYVALVPPISPGLNSFAPFGSGESLAGIVQWSPTLGARTETRRGWGTRHWSPTLTAKDAVRMGHPHPALVSHPNRKGRG